tara:strand:+ start:1341 stop:2903 length:1563 start_codon:yes stop_codon:yes gene_type:complete
MIRYYYFFTILINRFLLTKINFNKVKNIEYNHDFSNIYFIDYEKIKKILFRQEININTIDENYFYYHSFNWIKVAKEIGGSELVKITRDKILKWINHNDSFFLNFNNANLVAQRTLNLIYHFDFFGSSAKEQDKKLINFLIYKNYFFLKQYIKFNKKYFHQSMEIKKAILLFELIHKIKTDIIIGKIKNNLIADVSSNGMHFSMSPQIHAEYLNQLIEIKNIFLYFKLSPLKELDFQIIQMIRVLKSFIHKDGTLAYFNGSNNFYINKVEKIISIEKDIKSKNLLNNKNGLSIFENQYLKIIFDSVLPLNKLINFGLHASTLAFELSFNKEKIITNCGSLTIKKSKNPDYLRYSAAHSTITLNNTNISELVEKKSYKRAPTKVSFNVHENDNEVIWESGHNGYEKNFKKIITRKLIINKNEESIKGEDKIISLSASNARIIFSSRFHLTPICKAVLTRGKMSAIIKTKSYSYLFESDCEINLEESIYIDGENKIIKSTQIVIPGFVNKSRKTINWSISKY